MNKLQLLVTVSLVAVSSGAVAAEENWYAKLGYSYTDLNVSELDDVKVGKSSTMGYQVTLAYQPTPYIAIEGAYVNWGRPSRRTEEPYGDLETLGMEGVESTKTVFSGWTRGLSAVLSTDTSKPFSVGVRAGVHFWDLKARTNYRDEGKYVVGEVAGFDGSRQLVTEGYQESDRVTASDDGNDLYYGLTGTYRTGRWLISLDYIKFKTEVANPATTTLSFGMRF